MDFLLSFSVDFDLSQSTYGLAVHMEDWALFLKVQLLAGHNSTPRVNEKPNSNNQKNHCSNNEELVDLTDVDYSNKYDDRSLHSIHKPKNHSIINNPKIIRKLIDKNPRWSLIKEITRTPNNRLDHALMNSLTTIEQ